MGYAPEILQQPMRRVCARLAELGVKLERCDALEFFSRDGSWHTVSYAARVSRLDAWEIDPTFEVALRLNLPNARIRIGDSFELSTLPEFAAQFDFVVYDNPQVTFGARHQYCEHFEALNTLPDLMRCDAVVIFNVNRRPFDYDSFPEWQKRRGEFYRCTKTADLDESFLYQFYQNHFQKLGLTTRLAFIEPRHEFYLAYFVAMVTKRN